MHFAAIVIGPNPERQLAPYDATAKVERHLSRPVPEHVLERYREQLRQRGREVDDAALIELLDAEFDWAEHRVHEGRIWQLDDSNPKGEWDSWCVGGRFRGFFRLREGVPFDPAHVGESERAPYVQANGAVRYFAHRRRVDIARIQDIDFEGERDHAEAKVRALYEPWLADIERYGKPLTRSQLAARGKLSDAQADAAYRRQPAIAAFYARGTQHAFFGICPIGYLGFDLAGAIARARAAVYVPHAIVYEGQWRNSPLEFDKPKPASPGRSWEDEVHEIYASLPPDTLLTGVDCHC